MIRRIAIAALMTTAVGALSSQSQAEVLADSGFRPKPNGFSFANWGGKQYPDSRLTPDDVRYLFGEQACARIKANLCVPTPGATLWIDQMNRSTEGGHCEGMAVLSASFFSNLDAVDEFGARQAYELKPDNDLLMRTISTYFTTQSLEPVRTTTNATQAWSLQKIVDSLVSTLNAGSDYPTLGIYYGDGGHAVTPYGVESRGPGLYRINIYDNNYPGAEKFIDVDIKNDRWTYAGGALNPSEDPAPWQGKSGAMDVTMLSVRNEPLKCPFCAAPTKPKPKAPAAAKPKPDSASSSKPKPKPKPSTKKPAGPAAKPGQQRKPGTPRKPGAAAQTYSVVTANRCSQVQAVGKKSKNQIRMSANGVDNQIAGASMRPMRGSRGCMISLPPGQEYDVRLVNDGRPNAQAVTSLSIFGSGKAWTVDNVSLQAGATETFSVSQERFAYTAGSKQRPTLRVADSNNARNDYYEVSGFELNEGFEFTADEDEYGRMAFSDNDPDSDSFDVYAEVVGDEDTQTYDFEDVETGDDGQAMFDFDEDGSLDMELDSDSDGISDELDEDYEDESGDDNQGEDGTDAEDTDDDSDASDDSDDADDSVDSDESDDADSSDNSENSDDSDDSDNSDDSGDSDESDASDDSDDADDSDASDDSDNSDDPDDSNDSDDSDDADSADYADDSDGDDSEDAEDDSGYDPGDGDDDSSDDSEDGGDSDEDDGGEN